MTNQTKHTRGKRIGKQLRNLLMKSEHTYMISPTRAEYFGEVYTFDRVTQEELVSLIDRSLKLLDKKTWYKNLFDRLFK